MEPQESNSDADGKQLPNRGWTADLANNALIGTNPNYNPISYGNWVTVAPTNPTTITFNTNYDTRGGAATSGTFKTYAGAISNTSLALGLASVTTNNSGFLAGESITITGTSNGGGVFNGTWQVSSVSGPVVSFYIPNAANVAFASDSGVVTLDNVWGWRQNRIIWPHHSANYHYHIYGPFCPAVCKWMGQTVMDYFDDFGIFMEANQQKPPYIPNFGPGQRSQFIARCNVGKVCSSGLLEKSMCVFGAQKPRGTDQF